MTSSTILPPPPPVIGDFSFVSDISSREMLTNAYNAITRCELWLWMATYEPSMGYAFCDKPEIDRITAEMRKEVCGQMHSGSSFGITMRQMQYIAKHSFEGYRKHYLEKTY